ncbi:DgyrCDS3218 [Dimorphilus gyrociliatus]|uniref:DgyrCDS3218 n=1 Tax=Dimorphilus gyrociliatus TaxID=2664684 RepID=A0A7I8VDP2_9ANNE|nr:DgyrCDS3218 [Dimorphilus gyrociliatus]
MHYPEFSIEKKTFNVINDCYNFCLNDSSCVAMVIRYLDFPVNNIFECDIKNAIVNGLTSNSHYNTSILKDKKDAICGFSNPPHEECYRLLWKTVGCKDSAFEMDGNWQTKNVNEVLDDMRMLHNSVRIHIDQINYNTNRVKCFGLTSVSDKNIALYRSSSGVTQSGDVNNRAHATDGITLPDASLVIQIVDVVVSGAPNTCKMEVELNNGTSTEVVCMSSVQRGNSVYIRHTDSNPRYICEVEVYVEFQIIQNDLVLKLADENPAKSWLNVNKTLCGNVQTNPDSLGKITTVCKDGGVSGQFVILEQNSVFEITFNLSSIEVFGDYVGEPVQDSVNILKRKMVVSWGKMTDILVIDDNINTFMGGTGERNNWILIDLLENYQISAFGVMNSNTFMGVEKFTVYMSYGYEHSSSDFNDKSKNCVTNTDDILLYGYRIFKCDNPNPIGRSLVVYFLGEPSITFAEIEAYGTEILSDNFTRLKLVKVDENSEIKPSYYYLKFPIKVIDGNNFNYFINRLETSCTEVLHWQESRISVYLQSTYRIEQVVVMISQTSEVFRNVLVSVEQNSRTPERKICGQSIDQWKNRHSLIHFNCSLIGDKVSFYRSHGNRKLILCEVVVYGKNLNSLEKRFGFQVNETFQGGDIKVYGFDGESKIECDIWKKNIVIISNTTLFFECFINMAIKSILMESDTNIIQFCDFYIIAQNKPLNLGM